MALTLPRLAHAEDPEITLELDEDFWISAKLSDPDYSSTTRFYACWIADQMDTLVQVAAPGGKTVELGRVRVGNNQPNVMSDRFIVSLLAPGASVECTRDEKWGTWKPISVRPLRVKSGVKSIQSPIAALSPGIDWLAFRGRFREALLGALGTPTTCDVSPKSEDPARKAQASKDQASKGVKCVVNPLDDVDGHLRLTVTGTTDVQRLMLHFSKPSSVPVTFSVAQCTYHATGALPYIVAGASRQTLFLVSQRPECQARLDQLTTLEAGGHKPISAGLRTSSRLDEGKGIELSSIPATLSTGELTFTLKANGEAIGTATVPVLEGISAGDSPKVRVTYDVSPLSEEEFLESFSARTNDGIAAVTPKGAQRPYKILNTVSIPVKPPLPSVSEDIESFTKGVQTWSDNERFELSSKGAGDPAGPTGSLQSLLPEPRNPSSRWLWRIRPTKGAPSFDPCGGHWDASCDLKAGPGMIGFSVREPSPSPIEAALELVEVVLVTVDNPVTGKKELRASERAILETTIRLAASARVESVPLPIRDRLYVDCRGANTNIVNSEMRAIDDDDVVNGTCALVLLPVSIGKPGPARDLSLYRVDESNLGKAALVGCKQQEKIRMACVNKKDSGKECRAAEDEYIKCSNAAMQEASSPRSPTVTRSSEPVVT